MEKILTKSSFSNIIENFAQIVEEINKDTGKLKSIINFPRCHQLRVVTILVRHANDHGVGHKYMIQHSAGSGKSNSITWVSHQLVGLHDSTNTNDVFISVIVVTDLRVLDQQIRDNIKQFAQVKKLLKPLQKEDAHTDFYVKAKSFNKTYSFLSKIIIETDCIGS